MDAIEKGDKAEANNIINSTTILLDFSDRIPEVQFDHPKI